MFQGSRNVANGEHFSALMAEGGRLNATTWFDRTNYFETVPKGALELALWLEADRHGHLLDAVTQENLDNQRDVVKEEKRQRYDNVPYGNALIDIYATVFPEGHPYHHPTIGSMEDLDAASLEDVHAFFRALLRPQQHGAHPRRRPRRRRRAFAAAERYFGPLPASAEPRPRRGRRSCAPLTEPVRRRARRGRPRTTGCTSRSGCRWTTTPEYFACLAGDRRPRRAGDLPARTSGWSADEQIANGVQAHAMGFVDGVSLGLHRHRRGRRAPSADEVEAHACEELRAVRRGGPDRRRDGVRAGPDRAVLAQRAGQPGGARRPICHHALLHGRRRTRSTRSSTGSAR